MLATESHWEQREPVPICRAPSPWPKPLPPRRGVRLDFLIEGIGPGTDRLCELEPGEHVWVNGPLGNSFSAPKELSPGAAGAILVGGGIGIAPLALLRRTFAAKNIPTRVLLGFRDEAHSGGLDDLFSCCEVRLASDDGHIGPPRLRHRPAGGHARRRRRRLALPSTPAARRRCSMRSRRSAPTRDVPCELAMESPMACGYGACFGCAVPKAGRRLPAPLRRRALVVRRPRPGSRRAPCLTSAASSWRIP